LRFSRATHHLSQGLEDRWAQLVICAALVIKKIFKQGIIRRKDLREIARALLEDLSH
jgi:hypothetical protein